MRNCKRNQEAMTPAELHHRLDALIGSVLALPACDAWTRALLRTVQRGDVEGTGLALMVGSRADALSVALSRSVTLCGVTFAQLAVACAVEAVRAWLAGDNARALRSLVYAEHNLASIAQLRGAA